jgi:hypothetical protein
MMRSRKIVLTILASASLVAGGCSEEEISTRREIYASQEKCAEDWNSEECEDTGQGRYYGPHYFYTGAHPYFYSRLSGTADRVPESWGFSGTPEGGSSKRAIGSSVSHISRGGFGKSSGQHGLLAS